MKRFYARHAAPPSRLYEDERSYIMGFQLADLRVLGHECTRIDDHDLAFILVERRLAG